MKILWLSLCTLFLSLVWANDYYEEDFELEVIAESCGVDLDDPIFNGTAYEMTQQELNEYLSNYFEEIGKECTEEEAETFNNALDDFQTCARFNLKDFIEILPNAIVGTAIECIVTANWSSVTNWWDPSEVLNYGVSDKCLNFEYGHNAFGDGFRDIVLHSDDVLSCFKALSESIPSCSIDSWPIPLVGDWLKPAACIMGEASNLVDDAFKSEMEIWADCLPEDGGCENNCAVEGSFFVHEKYGLPAPDAIKRIAGSEEDIYKDALERYEAYVSECTEAWKDRTTNGSNELKATDGETPGRGGILFVVGLAVGAILLGAVLLIRRRMKSRSTMRSEGPKLDTSATDNTPTPVV